MSANARRRRRSGGRSRRFQELGTAADSEGYRLLFHSNPQPMWIYDENTLEIFEVNDSAVAHYGYCREEFLSMTIKDLRPEEDVPALLASVSAVAERDHSGPWRHVTRDGDVIEVEISSHSLSFRGRPGRLVIATDVTERERLQRQLIQTQRLESLGQLAGGVAHDFNNLLGVILNYTAFVREEVAVAAAVGEGERWDPVRTDVEQIEIATRRAIRLTHQLLAFARREMIRPDVLILNDTVRGTEEMLRRTLGEHVELVYSLSEELWPVLADAGQMEQVLVNLVINGRDAMPIGGTLAIETSNVDVDESYAATRPGLKPGRYVRLRVSDSGQGMDPTVLEHAFEPFFTTKPKGEGTGLGLATIYGIVSQAGGEIRLYSEPGFGTTCTVMLPVTDQAPGMSPTPVSSIASGDGRVVLVVEDEDGVREVTRRILVGRGYEVLTAADGPEAVDVARVHEGAIDLLMTDVVMPRMLGREVAKQILDMRPSTHVLYMSGYAETMLGSTGRLAKGMILLDKPFSEHTLLAKVQEALATSAPRNGN